LIEVALSTPVNSLRSLTIEISLPDKNNGDSKKSGTLGKLFRNIGIRRSGRKQGFKQFEGEYSVI
jgi:hypothetical protein